MKKAAEKPHEGARFLLYFGPLLDALRALGGSGRPDEVVERIAADLKLSDELQNETIPSGESRFRNQVRWARLFLVREGFIDSSIRGVWTLTERGRTAHLSVQDARDIRSKWRHTHEQRREKDDASESIDDVSGNPAVTGDIESRLIDLLLNKLSPSGFERLSQRLLREAGFVQVVVTGRSGDGGIDGHGTLQVNPLVSFKVVFQCKRYKGSVSTRHVRDFGRAAEGRADKRILITTGTFTAGARREASRDGATPIELIDGDKLAEMFKSFELGLRRVTTYEIDETFFDEFKS
jgi:restriction system protein